MTVPVNLTHRHVSPHLQEERSALAKSAKEHWNHVPREGELALPPFLRAFARVGGLLLPQPPMPWARRVCGVLAFLLFSAYVYGIFQVDRARDEFERHVTSLYERGLYVKVTRIDGITGPVNALIPRNDTHHHFDTQGGMCDACINDLLPDPTPHQLWWGLVPRAAVGVVFGPPLAASSVLRARSILYFLSVYFGTMTVAQPLLTVIFDPPGNLYIGHLAGAGVQAMTGMGLMASLYGMYWDEALHLTVINYVPGWAFLWQAVWTFLLAVLTGLMVVRGGRMYTLLFLAGLTYATFWLFIPLVGYTWWFAWEYVDTVAAQEFEQTMVTGAAHGEEAQPLVCLFLRDISFPKLCHRGAVPSSSATHAPFRQTAAMDLGPPFAVCAYGGFACWVVAGLFALGSNWRHLHRLEVDAQYRQQVFIMAANRANLHREERGRLMMGVAMVESRAQERARAAADPSREMV